MTSNNNGYLKDVSKQNSAEKTIVKLLLEKKNYKQDETKQHRNLLKQWDVSNKLIVRVCLLQENKDLLQ